MKQNLLYKRNIFTKGAFPLLLILFSLHSFAGVFDPVKQLAERRVPWLVSSLVFEKIGYSNGQEVFELSSSGDKIVIAAATVNSAAVGLNWYLQYYCHRSMSHVGDNLSSVYPLPKIKKKVRIISPFQYRYALNYCTLNYTMSFYNWKDWERELDWMALHGVNLMLATVGVEAVWQQTLKRFGFSDKEIKAFIPGPAFNAWWLMGNMEGWGGPITQRMINRRTLLEQKILARMHELGIEPVLQGFYGMAPRALKKHFPHADIRSQGKWAGGFDRPDFLLPEDSLFHRMAIAYYREVKKLYGSAIHFFGGDPFHEGGSVEEVDLFRAGHLIQANMQKVFPGSTWVLQAWQVNPRKKMLEGLDKSKVLVLELAGEKSNDWERRKGFENTPFLWCTANNFGDKSGLYGKLQFFADEVARVQESPYKNLCKGIGIMPEGIHNNPVVYDLMLELGWHTNKINVNQWIRKYTRYRYGVNNDTIQNAWQIFLKTVYRNIPDPEPGLPEDIFCARPSWNIQRVSTWGSCTKNYDTALFANGAELFLSAYPTMHENKTYLIDALDFARQGLSNQGDIVYRLMQDAYKKKDSVSFKKYAKGFLNLILKEDSLLSLNGNFQLETWLQKARDIGQTPYEKALCENNARKLITYWGADYSKTDLHDYANKEWSGLLRTFYLPRWQMFVNNTINELRGKPLVPVDYFKFESNWVKRQKTTPIVSLRPGERANFFNHLFSYRTNF